MTTTTNHTEVAEHLVGEFVQRAGKKFLVVRCGDGVGGSRSFRVTPDDVAEFFATQARNLASGCRWFAGLTGDWRAGSGLAQGGLDWFNDVNAAVGHEWGSYPTGSGADARRALSFPGAVRSVNWLDFGLWFPSL